MRLREQLEGIRQRAQTSATGRLVLRFVVGLLGTVVVAVGIVLIPFPGPGWLIVLAGLAILSIEFAWARRLMAFTRSQLEKWWHWLGRQNLVVRMLAGLIGLVFVTMVVTLTLYISFDITLGDVRRFFTE